MSNAYFISPRGKIIPVLHGTHIRQIESEPRTFGLTETYLSKTRRKYDEPRGFEGKARYEIISGLFVKGWIRVRFEDEGNLIFQTSNFTVARMKHILNFLILVQNGMIKPYNREGKYFGVLVYYDRNNPIVSTERVTDAIRNIQKMLATKKHKTHKVFKTIDDK